MICQVQALVALPQECRYELYRTLGILEVKKILLPCQGSNHDSCVLQPVVQSLIHMIYPAPHNEKVCIFDITFLRNGHHLVNFTGNSNSVNLNDPVPN